MKIYPKDAFEIDSPLSAGEIISALNAVVEPATPFRWPIKRYRGEFSDTNFKIWRTSHPRKSPPPIVEGQIAPTASGSRIAITIRLHMFVTAVMLLCLGGAGVRAVTFFMAAMSGRPEPLPDLLVPLGIILFVIVMGLSSFWWEAKKTKAVLIELMKGVERQPTSA